MERIVSLLFLIFLSSCQACLEDDQLVPLECRPGERQLCDHEGAILSSLDPDDPPKKAGRCQ